MANNIQINHYNGSSYTVLYPETLGSLVSGAVATATKLASTFAIKTNLGSTSYAYADGSTTVTPGVTGTLPVARGGTGVTSLSSLASNLSSYMSGAKTYLGQYTGTGSKSLTINCGFQMKFAYILECQRANTINHNGSGVFLSSSQSMGWFNKSTYLKKSSDSSLNGTYYASFFTTVNVYSTYFTCIGTSSYEDWVFLNDSGVSYKVFVIG